MVESVTCKETHKYSFFQGWVQINDKMVLFAKGFATFTSLLDFYIYLLIEGLWYKSLYYLDDVMWGRCCISWFKLKRWFSFLSVNFFNFCKLLIAILKWGYLLVGGYYFIRILSTPHELQRKSLLLL